MTLTLRGSMTALVTPFKHGKVDEAALKRLVEIQIREGTSGLVPCGSTGESATLSHEEHQQVIDLVVQTTRGRVPVIAGTGSNNTQEAIRLTAYAKRVGADAALLIAPYYNKPTQRGLYLHYKAIAEAVELPLVPYNIASRTGVNIEPETIARLVADVPSIVAIKEASGNLEQMSRILQLTSRRITLLAGDDALTLPVLAIGGTGVISVVSNLIPGDVAEMVAAFEQGRLAEATDRHYRMLPLVKALFLETNPIPVKTAMAMLGSIEPDLRLPLCSLSEPNEQRLRKELQAYGLLKSSTRRGASPSSRSGSLATSRRAAKR